MTDRTRLITRGALAALFAAPLVLAAPAQAAGVSVKIAPKSSPIVVSAANDYAVSFVWRINDKKHRSQTAYWCPRANDCESVNLPGGTPPAGVTVKRTRSGWVVRGAKVYMPPSQCRKDRPKVRINVILTSAGGNVVEADKTASFRVTCKR